MSALSRARARLARRKANLKKACDRVIELGKRVANTEATIRRLKARPQAWHPGAKRVIYADAGAFVTGKPKLCWHTTEGTSLPSYSGSAPHFTLNAKTGDLYQHIAVNRSAKALLHPLGTVETNRASAIQVELIGFAGTTQDWSAAAYAEIAKLARWIEANTGVRRICGVRFERYPPGSPPRLSPAAWIAYEGHCGHQHVPNNNHGDPGALRIERIL